MPQIINKDTGELTELPYDESSEAVVNSLLQDPKFVKLGSVSEGSYEIETNQGMEVYGMDEGPLAGYFKQDSSLTGAEGLSDTLASNTEPPQSDYVRKSTDAVFDIINSPAGRKLIPGAWMINVIDTIVDGNISPEELEEAQNINR